MAVALVALSGAAGAAVAAGAARSAAPGSIGIRLLDAGSTVPSDPRARLYIVDHLAPGTSVHHRVEVLNTTAATAHVTLYSAAATIVDGVFSAAAGRTPNQLSTWTSVTPGVVDVPAGARVVAAVNVKVPLDAAPGEKYAAVWAEVSSTAVGTGAVVQVSRVGVRLYVSAGPGGAPDADFTIDSMTASRDASGRPVLHALAHNIGGRALDMSGALRLVDESSGLSAGPYPASLGVTIAIGATEDVALVLDPKLPSGPWDAELTLRSGLVERVARAVITFPNEGSAPAVKPDVPRQRSLVMLIVAALAGLLVSFAASVGFIRWRTRQKRSV